MRLHSTLIFQTFVTTIAHFTKNVYYRMVLGHPSITILSLLLVLAFFLYHAQNFRLDASTDALLLDNDKDLQTLRELNDRYHKKDFLLITFSPYKELFSNESLQTISNLKKELQQLALTDSVVTLLDIPLVKQIEGRLSEIESNYRTLESADVDKIKAENELINSPIFSELIVSRDGKTTALQINLKDNHAVSALLAQRNALLHKKRNSQITVDEQQRLTTTSEEYYKIKSEATRQNHENILAVRNIMDKYRSSGTLYLGGVSMISDDMISFIKNDLIIFGSSVFLFFIMMLSFIFRRLCWIVLPLCSCVYAGLIMIGLLGFVSWDVTVISSNFISLMLIITMSMNIHLVVRYRQLQLDMPQLTYQQLIQKTISKMFWPCLYTALTTIIAFNSLVISSIKPVVDFGWMMTIGLAVTLITSFLLFPTLLSLIQKNKVTDAANQTEGVSLMIMPLLSSLTIKHGNKILLLTVIIMAVSIFGISKLEVENSFIDYFGKNTEIYKGLQLIDNKLGGTTSLDIVLKFNENDTNTGSEENSDFEFYFVDTSENTDDYWFTPYKLNQIKQIHDYLDSLPAIGKVLSLASLIRIGEDLNQGEFNAFELAIVYKNMPENLRASMLDPYLSIEHNEAIITTRVVDSLDTLKRQELLEQINEHLTNTLGIAEDRLTLSGLTVLYNNMLQSLFSSQINTLWVVMVGIFLMLLILFRSVILATIGIIPNVLAASTILGMMGLFGIPLDMMTIIIAGITIGISVDNAIHYIYRFQEEFAKKQNYIETLLYCHANIGRAVFYNAITIMAGFSILMLSNFVPTVYFGLLTTIAMLIALLASLTLLPKLILMWKPFPITDTRQ